MPTGTPHGPPHPRLLYFFEFSNPLFIKTLHTPFIGDLREHNNINFQYFLIGKKAILSLKKSKIDSGKIVL